MKRILEQLYYGDLYPYSKFQTTIQEYKENRKKAFASYTDFLEKLPSELKKEFNELIDEHLDLLPLEMEQNFLDGFCIGMRMMAEVYTTSVE